MSSTVLLYDADCGFCRWAVSRILVWQRGGGIRAVALQDEEAATLLTGMDEAERMASWHLVVPGGTVHSAGTAVAPILRRLPGGAFPARVAGAFPGGVGWVYAWVAGHRNLLGRLVGVRACSVNPRAFNPRGRPA